jgi:hypothetical protein
VSHSASAGGAGAALLLGLMSVGSVSCVWGCVVQGLVRVHTQRLIGACSRLGAQWCCAAASLVLRGNWLTLRCLGCCTRSSCCVEHLLSPCCWPVA